MPNIRLKLSKNRSQSVVPSRRSLLSDSLLGYGPPKLSIVMPMLNEAAGIVQQLEHLQPFRSMGCELIVVDGGSIDESVKRATPLANRVIRSPKGRALQMNRGAREATGCYLLFLHADTQLPEGVMKSLNRVMTGQVSWGRFDVQLSGDHPMFRLIERMMNWRSRLSGIATGDQAILVRRALFEKVGGYPEIALMEDIELSHQLNKISPPCLLQETVVTSSRRWEEQGIYRTICKMWTVRLLFFFGVDPARLARIY